jgi:hypothetical protein
VASVTPTVSDLRILTKDPESAPSPYNLARGENLQLPQGAAIATCQTFYLSSVPIVPNNTNENSNGSVYITQGTTVRTQSGFTVDFTNGIITFSTAPGESGSLPSPFTADYNFNWFTDTDYTLFIGKGMELCGVDADVQDGVIAGTLDENLLPGVYDLALSYFYQARATQYADKYNASGGGQGQDVKSVCDQFMSMSKTFYASGIKKRDEFYTRQGQAKAPSSHFINYGVSPISGRF